jgi:hypothetical protein
MDANLAASAGIGSSTVAILLIVYRVFLYANGHRLVSDCCGKKGEIGFVVRDMPPSPQSESQSLPTAAGVVGGTKEIPHESTLKPSVTLSAIETSVTH